MRKLKSQRRTGASAVEFALIAPLFILMFFGIIEFARAMMVQQVLIQASREGAREAALPHSTIKSVKEVVKQFAEDAGLQLSDSDIVVSPDPAATLSNEPVTVTTEIAVSQISWIPSEYLPAKLQGRTTMRSERLD